MSSIDARVLVKTVHAVMREAAVLSFGTMVFPYNAAITWPERRAARAPPLKQWLLERDTFEEAVVLQYANMSSSEVRELVAGTGVGKSTRMPYLIARAHSVNGVVLLPDDLLPLHIVTYLVKKYEEWGGDVSVTQLRSVHCAVPMQTPCVYLASATTFLGRLAVRPTLLRDLGVDFLYLDESHAKVPAYTFFRYAVTSGIISGCKVFFGTATPSADVSMESGGVGRSVMKVSVADMSVASPSSVTERSPLFYKRIVDRTVVHLANDREISLWYQYYEDHDVPVYRCLMSGGSRPVCGIAEFLDTHSLCVLLVHAGFRYGHTNNVDTAICGGYVSVVQSDFSNASVAVARVPVAQSLRVQTMGRVGRYKPGTGYYADVDVADEPSGFDNDSAFYVYLWAVVFSLKVNDPDVAVFADVTGRISRLAAAVLLHSRLPALLMLQYVGNDGFYGRWSEIAPYILYSSDTVTREDTAEVNTNSWDEYTTGPVPYSDSPIVYRSAVKYPRGWQVIPAYAWTVWKGDGMTMRGLRSMSVVSASPEVATALKKLTFRESVASVDSVNVVHRRSASVGRPVTPIPRFSVVSAVGSPEHAVEYGRHKSVMSMSGSIRDTTMLDVPQTAIMIPEIYNTWHKQLPPLPNGVPVQRRMSEGVPEVFKIRLRAVDPIKYRYQKLYPMDEEYFHLLLEDERMTRADRAKLNDLLTGVKNITAMGGDPGIRREREGRYLLAVVRLHNHSVALKAQLAANVKTNLMERLTMSVYGDADRAEEDISESARMLKAFQIQDWFVGVDSKTTRASVAGSSCATPDYDYDESRARVALAFGAASVARVVASLVLRAVPFAYAGNAVCNAWVFGENLLMPSHAFEDVDTDTHQAAVGLVYAAEDDDFVVFKSIAELPGTVLVREADGPEDVYVVTYDALQCKVVTLGVYTLVAHTDVAYLHATFEEGNSGALIVGVQDGALLGLFTSYYGNTGDTPLSLVLPVAKFRAFIECK